VIYNQMVTWTAFAILAMFAENNTCIWQPAKKSNLLICMIFRFILMI